MTADGDSGPADQIFAHGDDRSFRRSVVARILSDDHKFVMHPPLGSVPFFLSRLSILLLELPVADRGPARWLDQPLAAPCCFFECMRRKVRANALLEAKGIPARKT